MLEPLFKKIDFDVHYIVSAIDQGMVGVPDIQRPFVLSASKVHDLFDQIKDASKSVLEKYHLLPKKYLENIGVANDRDRNQIANFTYVEWKDNLVISDDAPKDYITDYLERYDMEEQEKMSYYHTLPDKWYELAYFEFLKQLRQLMAKVIEDGFKSLSK